MEAPQSKPSPESMFATWDALVAYARAHWRDVEVAEDGRSLSRDWSWANSERKQMLTVRAIELAGTTWVEWGSGVADLARVDLETAMKAATSVALGRLERDDEHYWLSHRIPLGMISVRWFDEMSAIFAAVCDDVEQELMGGEDER